ncbi:type II toxin-antitoxin system PemK/MazF family toxin [Metabacillus lacus]|nr:type II toxin-antitoxin system PemK/MazF family toxin [Metabacillus lacus]
MSPDKRVKLARDRANADQGEFFFAKAKMSNGDVIPRPVFIIGKNEDSNDTEDVIVCSCTKSPARTLYDVEVQLKKKTSVRTNKIYTIHRDQMVFKINHNLPDEVIDSIIEKATQSVQKDPR